MRFRVMSCSLFRAVFSDKYVFCDMFSFPPFLSYSILLLQRMYSSLPFPQTHLPNTNRFNGWGVTLRDTLDTMYAMAYTTISKAPLGLWGILLFYAASTYFLLSLFVPPPFLFLPFPVFVSPSLVTFPLPFLSLLTPP